MWHRVNGSLWAGKRHLRHMIFTKNGICLVFLKTYLFSCAWMFCCMCVWAPPHVRRAHGGQQRAPDSLELELQSDLWFFSHTFELFIYVNGFPDEFQNILFLLLSLLLVSGLFVGTGHRAWVTCQGCINRSKDKCVEWIRSFHFEGDLKWGHQACPACAFICWAISIRGSIKIH